MKIYLLTIVLLILLCALVSGDTKTVASSPWNRNYSLTIYSGITWIPQGSVQLDIKLSPDDSIVQGIRDIEITLTIKNSDGSDIMSPKTDTYRDIDRSLDNPFRIETSFRFNFDYITGPVILSISYSMRVMTDTANTVGQFSSIPETTVASGNIQKPASNTNTDISIDPNGDTYANGPISPIFMIPFVLIPLFRKLTRKSMINL